MISHQHKCIFVHVPKTAGQSIEHAFIELNGLTWETREALLLRPRTKPEEGPRRLAHLKAREYVTCGHMTQEQYDTYFTFSFVCNPWSRFVSLYRTLGYNMRFQFKLFALYEFNRTKTEGYTWIVRPQSDFIIDENGNPLVDFIGRFENLQNDFSHVCGQIGIPVTELSHTNKSMTKIPKPWQDFYDDETKDFVADLYQRDIDLFGYEFD